MADTKQTDSKGRFVKGNTIAKDRGVDFGSKPENRHDGAWKKEETVRYQVEQVAQMGDKELQGVIDDDGRPRLVRNFAVAVKNSQWREIKEMIEMIYGKPKESVELSNPDGNLTPTVRIIDERTKL